MKCASTNGWVALKNEVVKPLNEGFLRGMQISVGVCQQKSVMQPLVAQASTNIGSV